MKKWKIIESFKLGGPGSGHHAHKGIPGHRGGSAASGVVSIPQVSEDQEGMNKWYPACMRMFGQPISMEGGTFDQSGRKGVCEQNAMSVFKSDPEAKVYFGTILRVDSWNTWRPLDGGHFFNVRDGKIIDSSPFNRDDGKIYYFGKPVPGVTKSTSAKKLWQLKNEMGLPSWKDVVES